MPYLTSPVRYGARTLPFISPGVLSPPQDDFAPQFNPNYTSDLDVGAGGGLDARPLDGPSQPIDSPYRAPVGGPNRKLTTMPPPGGAPAPTPAAAPPTAPVAAPDTDAEQTAGQARLQQLADKAEKLHGQRPQDPKDNWAQRLGMAVLSMTKLAPYANQIIHPKFSAQEAGYQRAGADLSQQIKEEQGLETAGSLLESRAANAAYKKAQAAQEANVNEERMARTEATAQANRDKIAAQTSERNRKFLADRLKGREGDSQYQSKDVPLPLGYEFVEDPEHPGFGFAAPPAWRPATEDLIKYLPGTKVGDMVPHSEYMKALDAARQVMVAGAKPDRPATITEAELKARSAGGTTGNSAVDAMTPAQAKAALSTGAAADRGQNFVDPATHKLIRVEPGGDVPAGAVTASGLSAANTPTSSTRSMVEIAPRVINFVDRAKQLMDENENSIGPLAGRWSDFVNGKVGLPNKGYAQLRTNLGLLETALMRMHTGARGGVQIMDHFHNLIGFAQQSPENLRAALDEIKAYANQVKSEGQLGGQGGGQSAASDAALPGGITLQDIQAEKERRRKAAGGK